MAAVVILEAIVLVLLILLVIGLLRTHAEVLRRLHELGAGVYDDRPVRPSGDTAADLAQRVAAGVAAPRQGNGTFPAVSDISGVTPRGSHISVSVAGPGRTTLLAFLSTGCTTCADFWEAWRDGASIDIGGAVPRVVVVTKGPQNEEPRAVATLAAPELTVVMSNDAWTNYAVPASPYFVLVDGAAGVVGEGSAASFAQLRGVLNRAVADRPAADGRDNPARVDAELRRAGIEPGDRRLYEFPQPAGPVATPGPEAGRRPA